MRLAILLALVLSSLPLAAQAPAAAAAPAAVSTAERARAVSALLTKGDFAAVAGRFSPAMAKALSAEQLEAVWEGLPAQLGALKSLGEPVVRADSGVEVAYVPATFEKVTVALPLAFDGEGRLAGFRIVPSIPEKRAAWTPPPYVDPSRFTESQATVGAGEWALPGTVSVPIGEGPFPAVVLVHGSGPHDRDETVGGVSVFRDLAGALASRGVAVLRYEKRSKVHGARMAGLAITVKDEVIDDAVLGAALLRKTPRVDPARVAVLGHSLGGYLVPRILRADGSLAGGAIVSGNTRPIEDLIVDQTAYLQSVGAAPKEAVESMRAEVAKIKAIDPKSPPPPGTLVFHAPASYWLDLRDYDPVKEAKATKVPLLVVSGGRDYQVTARELEGWKAGLAKDPRVTFKAFPKANHLLVDGEGPSTPAEYDKPAHVAADAALAIAGWAAALPPRTP